jgi:signal transduction histidine kinase
MGDAESTVKVRISDRVEQANFVATSIYNKYHDKEPEIRVKERIKEALRPMRWNGGRSYIWIVDYDSNSVLSPESPRLEGTSFRDFKDMKGNLVVIEQTKTAREHGEGFNKDYFTKFDKPKNQQYPQICFVKDFKHFNWYLGSAEFIDDYQESLKAELLKRVAEIRYDKSYIFINDLNGNALLSNGVMLEKPKNIFNLTDKNGVKIVQKEIEIAKNSDDGGYLDYIWHEASTNEDVSKMAFIRGVKDLDWMIGTSVPMNEINANLESLAKDIKSNMINKFIIVSIFFLLFFVLAYYAVIIHNRRVDQILSMTKSELVKSYEHLDNLNKNLQMMVAQETEKRLEKEKLLIQQSKMAMMGEMIGAIAHQWRQPLNALGISVQDAHLAYKLGDISDEYMEEFKTGSMSIIQRMSQTIDDFRNFFRPNKEKEEFILERAVKETLNIMLPQLVNHHIEVNFDQTSQDKIYGYKSELEQAILIIISNANDVLVDNKIENPKINISIKADKTANKVSLSIEDNGGGVPTEIIDRIFEPYFTTKEQGKGTGIGLYMAKEIIERQMGGRIYCENTDSGARFVVEMQKTF